MIGIDPVVGALGMNGIAAVSGTAMPGVMRAGVLKEIWTGEMVKALREFLAGSWLDGIPDNSSLVNNDVIHLVDVGVDPDVLVNNSTYPIPTQALSDADIAVQLDKFQTKVRRIRLNTNEITIDINIHNIPPAALPLEKEITELIKTASKYPPNQCSNSRPRKN